jgi:arginyl-tRNA--protein-N-Asp/Glu arginylyltransferase
LVFSSGASKHEEQYTFVQNYSLARLAHGKTKDESAGEYGAETIISDGRMKKRKDKPSQ